MTTTRRTVVLDDDLLAEARDVLGTRGVSDTVEAALREVVRLRRLGELRKSLGTFDLNITPDELLRQRVEAWTHDDRQAV